MEKIDKALFILQAFKEGKTIEAYGLNNQWNELTNVGEILHNLNFALPTIRIKKEPTYRPYANAEEFLKASKEHGPYMEASFGYLIPNFAGSSTILFDGKQPTYKYILDEKYKWQDGTPCGILEQ